MTKPAKIILIASCLFIAQTAKAQQGWGGMAGLSMSFGWPVNRIGLVAGGFYFYQFAQVNAQYRVFYNFSTFAPLRSGPEWQGAIGGVLGYGMPAEVPAPFLGITGNQTGRYYSLAYAYNYYIDRRGTSQPTGTVGIQIGRWQVLSENDVFVAVQDKYRTATLSLQYTHDELFRAGLATILWTGRTNKQPRVKNSAYPSRYGYIDMGQAEYGKRSHGVLCLYADRTLPLALYQSARAAIGIDDERIRHFFQNRVIHDMPFMPDAWVVAENPHVPMLDEDGKAYLYKEGQELRPAQPHIHLGMNPPQFY